MSFFFLQNVIVNRLQRFSEYAFCRRQTDGQQQATDAREMTVSRLTGSRTAKIVLKYLKIFTDSDIC